MPKNVTIKDVALAAGVSPSLVSFVFNGKNRVGAQTRERVLEAARQLGYRPAEAPVRTQWPSARLVGVVVPELEANALWIEQLTHSAYRRGYTVQVGSAQNDPVHYAHLVRAFSEARGLVALLPQEEKKELTDAVKLCGIPYVIAGEEKPDQTIQNLISKL
ncbi:MAG: LacI family DNA-binding transcriptional regulator [Bacteroidales bacterium]|nr:LacI family DNA-binding transcriptional regulator [Bacteroidales bacterium]MBQ9702403.1 LacI family DNA-binding transcriptional regulator [Bacteroidales bacterium]